MRTLITLIAVFVCGLVLVLWLTHRTPPMPAAATRVDTAIDPASMPDKIADKLTPADGSTPTARVASSPTASVSAEKPSGPQCRVFGRVVDEHGAPLADVQVSLYPVNGRWSETTPIGLVGAEGAKHEGFVQSSASDGRFEFHAPLPTSDWVSLQAEGDLHRSLVERRFGPASYSNKPRLVEGDNDVGDLRLAPCGAVRGRVVSAAGSPVVGTWVGIPDADVNGREVRVQADEHGEFVIGHASAGKHTLEAYARGWIRAEQKGVEIVALRTISIPDLVLARAFEISGTVVDESGEPAAHVVVRSRTSDGRGFSARTNDEGEFTLYLELEGTCTLEVPDSKEFEAWDAANTNFETGTKNARIVLRRKDEFTFRVVDAHTHEPIERYGLRVDPKPVANTYAGGTERDIPLADHPRGEAILPKGEYVVVNAPGHAPFEHDVVPDRDDPHTQTIELKAPSAIRGRLLVGGMPGQSCTLKLWREGIDEKREFKTSPGGFSGGLRFDVGAWSGRKREGKSGADGTFVLGDLAPGTYALQIEGGGAARKRLRGLEVPAESALELGDVRLDQGAIVRGVIVTEPSTSPVGFHVHLGFESSRAATIDNVDGKFEFQGLEAGEYSLTWGRPSQTSWSSNDPHLQKITLGAGEVRDVLIDASASAPCAVTVHVTRGGRPVEGLVISVRVASPATRGSTTSKLGECDSKGTATGEVDGDAVFDLQAMTDAWSPICTLATGIRAQPGGSIERTLEVLAGKLTIELSPTIPLPEKGILRVVLEAPDEEQLSAIATTAGAGKGYRGNVVWSGRTIACGEFGAGSYEATVYVQRLDPDPERPARSKAVDLREPYKTKVVIEADHETKIVVP